MAARREPGRLARQPAVLALVLLILACGGAHGEDEAPVRVQAAVNRQSVTIGDPITYTLVPSWKPGITIIPPTREMDLGSFEVLEFAASDPVESEGRITQVFTYTIAVYDLGEHTIPAAEVSYTGESGQVGTAAAGAIPITVGSVITEKEPTLRPIKAPLAITPRLSRVLLVMLPLIVAVAAVLIYLLWWRRRPKRDVLDMVVSAPQLSPEEEAYRALEEIAGLGLLGEGRIKEHYTLVSEVIRRYLGRRFQIQTLERTTTEVLRDLDPILDASLLRDIGGFLRDCDSVKFAKYVPPQVDRQRLIRRATQIVDTCAPSPEPEVYGEALAPIVPSQRAASTPVDGSAR